MYRWIVNMGKGSKKEKECTGYKRKIENSLETNPR